jgi:formylglycine-generating enzyme required for sulfatase activity
MTKKFCKTYRAWMMVAATALGQSHAHTIFDAKELELVKEIRTQILKGEMPQQAQTYTLTIPNTTVSYSMTAIPAGSFLIGSPPREKHRKLDEGPQTTVSLPAFWMATFEVTWNEYELFIFARDTELTATAVSHPTKPYVEMSFGMGREGYPAISMTQHAASKYCQWLSAKTGHFYRLPTEAEWEYAARAGSITAYSFADSPAKLKEYAVFDADKYAKVGTKKPNPWGLHDMHGNVLEWTLDQYMPDAYASLPAQSPWIVAVKPYPHSVRGGSWADTAAQLRSAARRGSEAKWKMLDPQRPKSIWYHTSAPWIGFRIVRPVAIPSAEQMYRYWNSGVERDR